jgi:hypothetical protein
MEELRRERAQFGSEHAAEPTDDDGQPITKRPALPGKLELRLLRERGRFLR